MVAPESRSPSELIQKTGDGFRVLGLQRNQTHYGTQEGRWRLQLEISFGKRTRVQNLDFSWFKGELSGPQQVPTDEAILSAPPPSRVELWIKRQGDQWIWRLKNKELKYIGPCKLRIDNAQSFDPELKTLREPSGFTLNLGSDPRIEAGAFGKDHLFARLAGDHLEIGDTKLTRLPWPNGDTSEAQPWLLTLELSGLSSVSPGVKWIITLSVIWNTASKTLEFPHYTSKLHSS